MRKEVLAPLIVLLMLAAVGGYMIMNNVVTVPNDTDNGDGTIGMSIMSKQILICLNVILQHKGGCTMSLPLQDLRRVHSLVGRLLI